MFNGELSALSSSDSGAGSSSKSPQAGSLDVADVPDKVLEALHWARTLQLRGTDPEVAEIGVKIEELLRDVPRVLAAAAEQLAEADYSRPGAQPGSLAP